MTLCSSFFIYLLLFFFFCFVFSLPLVCFPTAYRQTKGTRHIFFSSFCFYLPWSSLQLWPVRDHWNCSNQPCVYFNLSLDEYLQVTETISRWNNLTYLFIKFIHMYLYIVYITNCFRFLRNRGIYSYAWLEIADFKHYQNSDIQKQWGIIEFYLNNGGKSITLAVCVLQFLESARILITNNNIKFIDPDCEFLASKKLLILLSRF